MSRLPKFGLSVLAALRERVRPGLLVDDFARERDQSADLVAALADVFGQRQMPAHGLDAARQHHHRLGLAVEQRRDVLAEMLDDDRDLLADVVGVKPHPAHDAFQRGVALDFDFVPFLAAAREAEGEAIGRVVLQDVEDEAFLDRLPHRIDVERLRLVRVARRLVGVRAAAEDFQRLGLRRRGEGDIGDARLARARRHLRGENVFRADLAAVLQRFQFVGREHRLELRRRRRPLCDECASSAMTANRLPCVAASSCTASSAKGKVWIVQTMIFLPCASAWASCPLLLPLSLLMVTTTPCVRSKAASASCNCPSITLRSETTMTVEKSFWSLASCRSARKCAVQAIELVLPDPAEC